MGNWKKNKPKGNHNHRNRSFNNKKPNWRTQNKPHQGNSSSAAREPRSSNWFSSLKEHDVGITEYVNEGPGFNGIIKSRFSDFQVHEIDSEGNEVKLTNFEVPVAKEETFETEELAQNKTELKDIITDDIWNRIRELIAEMDVKEKKSVDIDVTELDKIKRTLVHKTLKAEFGPAVVSTTSAIGDTKKLIQCFKAKGQRERKTWSWPGEYVYFVVYKENVDTVRASSDLAHNLCLRPSCVNYAGTKDKRAITTQRFCIKKRYPEHIAKAAKSLRYMKLGNFTFKEKVLKLGDLKGNRFQIAVRQIDGDNEQIESSLKNIKTNGFINYYGLQRFGNCSGVPTFDIGIALLKSDYKEACELILKPRPGEPNYMKETREFWWKTRDSVKAASMLYNDKLIEKKLLNGLADYGENDYSSALRMIPRNILLLYTHAYQSLIWNRVASRRIKDFGLKLIVGDLVLKDKSDGAMIGCTEVLDDIDPECVDDPSESAEDDQTESPKSEFKAMVKAITEDDISTGKYSIFDVVLPLPGYDISYPSNQIATWYEEILAEKDLTSEKLRHNVKTYSLAGAYRHLIVLPENLKWEIKHYDSPLCTLVASDVEVSQGKEADADLPDGKFKALILDFSLPSAAYATMILRELLKADTSVESQQKLTEELNEKNRSVENENDTAEPEITSTSAVEKQEDEEVDKEMSETNGISSTDDTDMIRKRKPEVDDVEAKKPKVD